MPYWMGHIKIFSQDKTKSSPRATKNWIQLLVFLKRN